MISQLPGIRGMSVKTVRSRMSKKGTLQAFLSPQRLYELAGPKVYARGEKYSADDHVRLLEHTRDEAIAEVIGSQPYRVEMKLTSKGLIASCTCPAISDHGFCKHVVALGLYLINAPAPTAKRPPKRKTPRVTASLKSTPISLAGSKMGGSKSGGMATAHPLYEYLMKADWFGKEAQDTGPWIKSCKRLTIQSLIG